MLNALQIHITNECNLKCPYCFNTIRSGRNLPPLKISAVINNLFAGRENDFYLHFIGGEPLLRWNEIKNVLRTNWIIQGFVPNHSITTNGKQLNAQVINDFKILNTKITLSIEGRKERHQALRIPFSDMEYAVLLQNTQLLINTIGSNNVVSRMTLYGDHWDVTEDVEFLITLGIRQFKILPDLNIMPDISYLALKKLKERFSERVLDGQISIFPLDDQLMPSSKNTCGVGKNLICVAPDENFYPCHRFVYNKNLIIGNIKDGLNSEAINNWSFLMKKLRLICHKCPSVNICNFPCPYPKLESIDPIWCSWMKGIK